jgi:hypothetical protein
VDGAWAVAMTTRSANASGFDGIEVSREVPVPDWILVAVEALRGVRAGQRDAILL